MYHSLLRRLKTWQSAPPQSSPATRTIIWVCQACGKRSHDRAGNDPLDQGWDMSCYLNAVQCYAHKDGYIPTHPQTPEQQPETD